jgi:PhnB protein
MKGIAVYLIFDGNCREAMRFYARCFGAELYMMPYSEAPPTDAFEVSDEAKDRIVHSTLTKGSAVLMAADTLPGMPFQQGNNFSVSITCESLQEIESLFAALGENGKITMPLQDTFWEAHFGMLIDQFDIQWMLSFPKAKQT